MKMSLQYKSKNMDEDLFISILNPLSPQAIEDLTKSLIEAECIFTEEPDCEDQDEFISSEHNYVFQIRRDFLLECEPKSKKIVGGIPLTLDYKFQIKRFTYDPTSELGKPYAFILYMPEKQDEDEQVVIKLGVKVQGGDTLQNFASCLEKKPIFQLDLHNNFKVTQRLFFSMSAALYSATRHRDEKQVVIKCIRKDVYTQTGRDIKKGIERQYGIPRKLDSPRICKYYGVYENETSIYIVMEKLELNFLQYLQFKLFSSFEQLRTIFYGICEAVNILHENCIMHRDIKPENIMMRKIEGNKFEPVLIDFGLAEYDGKQPYLFAKCGTPGYAAPEITQSNDKKPTYNRSCDVFSLGCLFHFMVLRRPLFDGSNIQQIIQKNKECKIYTENQQYQNLEQETKNLLFRMLEIDPQKRIKIKQILDHEFFVQKNEKQAHENQNFDSGQNGIYLRQETDSRQQ